MSKWPPNRVEKSPPFSASEQHPHAGAGNMRRTCLSRPSRQAQSGIQTVCPVSKQGPCRPVAQNGPNRSNHSSQNQPMQIGIGRFLDQIGIHQFDFGLESQSKLHSLQSPESTKIGRINLDQGPIWQDPGSSLSSLPNRVGKKSQQRSDFSSKEARSDRNLI